MSKFLLSWSFLLYLLWIFHAVISSKLYHWTTSCACTQIQLSLGREYLKPALRTHQWQHNEGLTSITVWRQLLLPVYKYEQYAATFEAALYQKSDAQSRLQRRKCKRSKLHCTSSACLLLRIPNNINHAAGLDVMLCSSWKKKYINVKFSILRLLLPNSQI